LKTSATTEYRSRNTLCQKCHWTEKCMCLLMQ